MLPIISAYVAPSTSNIAPGLANASADVKNLILSSGGVNDRLSQLSKNAQRTFVFANNNANINPNEDVQIIVNATAGAFSLKLPSLANQYKPIFFEGIGTSYNWVTLNCFAGDKVEDISVSEVTPSKTSVSIYCGGMSFMLCPTPTGWRIAQLQMPLIGITVRMSANQTLTSSTLNSDIRFNSVVGIEPVGFYNTTTWTCTPKVPGQYLIKANIPVQAGGSSQIIMNILRNGADIRDQINLTTANGDTLVTTRPFDYYNGSTDNFKITGRTQGSAGSTRIVDSFSGLLDSLTYLQARWISF